MNVEGKTVVLTGATGGIGASLCADVGEGGRAVNTCVQVTGQTERPHLQPGLWWS